MYSSSASRDEPCPREAVATRRSRTGAAYAGRQTLQINADTSVSHVTLVNVVITCDVGHQSHYRLLAIAPLTILSLSLDPPIPLWRQSFRSGYHNEPVHKRVDDLFLETFVTTDHES